MSVKCDQCDFEAKNQTGLAAHMRVHKTRPRKKKAQPRAETSRRAKAATPVTDGVVVHFCPNCGTDLDKVRRAIALSERAEVMSKNI